MSTLFRTNLKSTDVPPKTGNSTRPYQNFLNSIDLPEPLFIAIIAAGSLLVLLTCCLITSRYFCKSCFWTRKPKADKKRLVNPMDINMLIQNELDFVHSYGKLDFRLGYKESSQTLTVKIVQASDLPASIDGSLDPYVIVTTNSKSNSDEKRTKTKMQTERPIFNQKFQFKILEKELLATTVTFKVLDYDKYGADALLGQLTLMIKDHDPTRICHQMVDFSMMLCEGEDICQGMGQVCIVLNHSKTGLMVTILEAKNVRIKEESNYSFVFVEIKFQIKKTPTKYKTKVVRETKKCPISKFPYFNEVFIFHGFNVPLSNFRVKFKMFMSGKFRMPTCIGYIILGAGVNSQSGELHWESMLDNPRHPVAKWHVLINPNIKY